MVCHISQKISDVCGHFLHKIVALKLLASLAVTEDKGKDCMVSMLVYVFRGKQNYHNKLTMLLQTLNVDSKPASSKATKLTEIRGLPVLHTIIFCMCSRD